MPLPRGMMGQCRHWCSLGVAPHSLAALAPDSDSRLRIFINSEVSSTPGGGVGGVVGIEGGVVSGVINLESSGVSASDWRPRHKKKNQQIYFLAACPYTAVF